MKGKVKYFNSEKRFGFINGDDGNAYFVHLSNIVDQVALADNDEVEFEGNEGDRGLVATKVTKL